MRVFYTTYILPNSLPYFRQNEDVIIAGIICFHEITLTRMGQAARSAFKKLLCSDALTKDAYVLLVTTGWEKVGSAIGKKREEDLRKWMIRIRSGAKMTRFQPPKISTSMILDILLHKPSICVQALVDQQRPTKNTNGAMDWLRKAFTADFNTVMTH